MHPKISIIIVSFNTLERTREAIYSIPKRQEYQIIVVDNHSSDGSVQMIRNEFKDIELIENTENLGFARANNQAFKISKGKFVLLLNSDTRVLGNAIEEMLQFIEENNSYGIVSCVLKNPDGSIQMQGGYLPNLVNITAWMLFLDDIPFISSFFPSYQLRDIKRVSKPIEVGWVGGTAMFIRKKVIDAVGEFNKDIFMYGEDVEYCQRVQKAGYKIALTNQANITHYGQQSSSGTPKNAIIGEFKAMKMIFGLRKAEYVLIRLVMKLGALLRMFIFGILQGKCEYYEIYKQAYQVV